MNAGDASARGELVGHARERLLRLTRKMLQDFRRVHRWEDSDDVLHDALFRLDQALQVVKVASVREFFRLAAKQIRRQLIDLARHYYGPQGPGKKHATPAPRVAEGALPGHEKADTTFGRVRAGGQGNHRVADFAAQRIIHEGHAGTRRRELATDGARMHTDGKQRRCHSEERQRRRIWLPCLSAQ